MIYSFLHLRAFAVKLFNFLPQKQKAAKKSNNSPLPQPGQAKTKQELNILENSQNIKIQ
jgi:hypothetical protein